MIKASSYVLLLFRMEGVWNTGKETYYNLHIATENSIYSHRIDNSSPRQPDSVKRPTSLNKCRLNSEWSRRRRWSRGVRKRCSYNGMISLPSMMLRQSDVRRLSTDFQLCYDPSGNTRRGMPRNLIACSIHHIKCQANRADLNI